MIKVNLAENAQKRVTKAVAKTGGPSSVMPLVLVLIMLGAAVGGYFWYVTLNATAADLTEQVVEKEKEKKELENIIKLDQVFEARKAALEARITIIDDLLRNQISPVVSLDMLGQAIDRTQFVWLSSLDQNNTTFSISGTGTSVDALADFVTNLENTGYFRNIDLKRYEDSRGNFTFTMTCEFLPPNSAKPAQELPRKGAN